jgi:poly-gamma-glutamate capsule biosynthesis protein CapA/YwtB (metallophosphatase superfamily)
VGKTLVSFILLIFVICSSGFSQINSDNGAKDFPYSYVHDDSSPKYSIYRAEGRKPASIFFHSFKYLKKYKNKKNTCSSAEKKYFEDQTKMFQWICEQKNTEKHVDNVKIGLVGDIMWIRDNWSSFVDEAVLEEMQRSDLWIGNLETLIDKDTKVRSFLPDYLKYNSDSSLLTSFMRKDQSPLFKFISLANNHILDEGDNGTTATLEFLDRHNILSSGISRNKNDKLYVTFVVNNIKIGFYAASWGVNDLAKLEKSELKLNILKGIAPIGKGQPDLSEVKSVLKEMESEGVDFKIISLHWGAEYEMYPDVQQIIIAREIVSGGADLILGHHPHVIQPFEVYFMNGYEKKYNIDTSLIEVKLKDETKKVRKALVLYSLGNFTTEMFTKACQTGVLFGINVFRNDKHQVDWEISGLSYVLNERNSAKKHGHKLVLQNKN